MKNKINPVKKQVAMKPSTTEVAPLNKPMGKPASPSVADRAYLEYRLKKSTDNRGLKKK